VLNELEVPTVTIDADDCVGALLTPEEYARELGVDVHWFLDLLFDGYSRLLYVDTGIGEREHYERRSKDFADVLRLKYEARCGTLEVLRARLNDTKALARSGRLSG
jgi:hypothetical protein